MSLTKLPSDRFILNLKWINSGDKYIEILFRKTPHLGSSVSVSLHEICHWDEKLNWFLPYVSSRREKFGRREDKASWIETSSHHKLSWNICHPILPLAAHFWCKWSFKRLWTGTLVMFRKQLSSHFSSIISHTSGTCQRNFMIAVIHME